MHNFAGGHTDQLLDLLRAQLEPKQATVSGTGWSLPRDLIGTGQRDEDAERELRDVLVSTVVVGPSCWHATGGVP